MMESIFLNYSSPFLAAIAIGFSCGTGCSPVISLFLTTHIMGNSSNVRKGLLSFFHFFLGKTSICVILAFLSALFGSAILGNNVETLGFDLKLILDIFLIIAGLVPILRMLTSKKKHTCKTCNQSCDSHDKPLNSNRGFTLFGIGAAYGITPCAPLLMVLFLASLNSPLRSLPISILFSIASSISPLILLSALAGFFSKKMYAEIPQFINIFQFISFIIFIAAGSISLFYHLK